MPAQDRRGHDRETQSSVAYSRYHGEQRREYRAVGPGQLRASGVAAFKEGDLVAQQQDLGVVSRRGPPREPQPRGRTRR
jgi:hypothetical protein